MEAMRTCECGCGQGVDGETRNGPRRFVSGHNLRALPRTAKHRANIAEGQRRAWREKRERLPIGSTNRDSNGYVRVKVSAGAGRWMPQHRVVMEQHLDRKLRSGEVVHHVNGVRDDNRIENLYLCRDHAEHMEIEASLAECFRVLMAAGLARFNTETGRYEGVL